LENTNQIYPAAKRLRAAYPAAFQPDQISRRFSVLESKSLPEKRKYAPMTVGIA
jgi:hypothetical protein